jgi:hypothetical protein
MRESVNKVLRQPYFHRFMLFCLFVGWFVVSGSQALELYRCTRNGVVEFRQTACPEGEQAITEVLEQSKGISPIEPALRLPAPKLERSQPSETGKKPQATNERCWKTQKRLEEVERRLRAGYKPSQYEGLHRKQVEYEEYLKRFCTD